MRGERKNVPGRKRVMACRNVSGSCGCIRMVYCEPVFCLLLRIHGIRTMWRVAGSKARQRRRTMHPAYAKVPHRHERAVAQCLKRYLSGTRVDQAIIRAQLAGQRDAKTLAALRDPRCMASEEEIVHSLRRASGNRTSCLSCSKYRRRLRFLSPTDGPKNAMNS